MTWAALAASEVTYLASAAESARFGVDLARLTVGVAADPETRAPALSRLLASAGADVVVVRHPAEAGDCAAALTASGRQILPAGALVYWALAPGARRPVASPPGLVAVEGAHMAQRSLDDAVTRVIEESFSGYANHYSFNPLLDDAAALAGYVEWARCTTSDHRDADDPTEVGTVVLMQGDEPVGVATTTTGPEPAGGHHVELLLAGMAPQWQGRGWYQVLLAEVATRAFATGAARLLISTQVHNTRVQRTWARAGLLPFAAVETVHAVRSGLLTASH